MGRDSGYTYDIGDDNRQPSKPTPIEEKQDASGHAKDGVFRWKSVIGGVLDERRIVVRNERPGIVIKLAAQLI